MKRSHISLVIVILFSLISNKAEPQSLSQDTAVVYSYNDFILRVLEHHPKMISIALLDQNSQANRLMAKGEFDPKIYSELAQKQYDNKDYYSTWYSELKIPTWIGADIKASYENNDGLFLNMADNLPINGLLSIGVDMPLGAGLFYDERRRIVDEAELISELNDQEIIIQVNQLLADASLQYLKWQYNYTLYTQIKQIYLVSDQRWRNARISASTGEIAAIDTLELGINRTQWLQALLEAQQKMQGERYKLNNYLWQQGRTPLDLQDNAIPDSLDISQWQDQVRAIENNINQSILQHPEIKQIQTEGDILDLNRRLAREYLKPDLNLSYHPLFSVRDQYRNSQWLVEDYKFSANLSYPLLNRKQRGKVQLIEQKIIKNQVDESLLRQNLTNALLAELNRLEILSQEINLLKENVSASHSLLRAEEFMFQIGESSAFLVNSRETKYFESILKYLKKQYQLLDTKIYVLELGRQGLGE